MAWSFVGVSAVVQVTATSHALTEPAGCQAGDLLVAIISSRIASTTSITLPAGWTLVAESKTNNVVAAATTSEASGMMAYIVRGDTAPALTFTHPTAPSVAVGRIVAYRGGDIWEPFDVGVGAKTGTAITAVSTTGLTTTQANDLIVKGVCSGRASAFSAHDAATDPTTSSGTNSVQTAAPIVGTWQERQDATTTTGADTALAIADAIRGTAGATGVLTCTASVSGGHAQVAGAFKIEPVETPGSSAITQTGSTLDFVPSNVNSGTVSSTITVPSDAQIVLVGVKGWCSTAPYFTDMTFTKGGADTAMTRVGVSELGNGHTAAIFYLVLPDTGTNKSLKFDWAGSAAPGERPIISVTFWKGIDTASPIRSSGASLAAVSNAAFKTRSSLLTAQNGDRVVAFVGADTFGAQEGSVDTWYNLNLVSQCVNGAVDRHDGAWGSFAPSQNLYVGADAGTNVQYGVCAAVVLKPAPSPLKSFTVNSATSGTTVTTTIPATAAGDCIIVAGLTQGPYQPAITITAGGQSVAFGKLGGLTSPRYSPVGGHYDYVGIIINPTAGTTSVVLAGGTSGGHELACWVVSGLTNPVQDVGIWVPYQIDTVNISGLSGALAVADEFAVSFNRAANNTTSINTAQSGSSGFTASAVDTANFNSGYSYQFTTATTPIQAAWNVDSGGGNCLLATYRSTPPAAPTPPPISLVGFAGRQLFDTVMNLDFPGFPATQAGDCIIFAGWVDGSVAGIDIRTPTNELGVFGTLGGVTSPVLSGSVYNFVGLIASPAVGTTSIRITTTASNSKGLAAWVVRGLTAPVTQDKGVWNALEAEPVSVSGLTGTLADANEFAVSVARPPNQVYSANVEQTGSGGFLLDTLYAWFDGGVSHQITESTASIQAAWNSGTGGADVTLATYKGAAAGVTGTLAETEDADVAAINATVRWVAALAAPETVDVLASVGTVRWQATLAETEDPDVAALNATVRWNAPLATTEAPDVGAFVGNVARIAILATREGDDVTLINGTVVSPATGDLATTEAADTAALLGTISWQATLATTEAPDVLAFLGVTRWAVTLATTEAPDVAAFVGTTKDPASGPLVTREDPDVGAFTGTIRWQATLATVEAADAAAFLGVTRWVATLATVEAPDVALFNGVVRDPIGATLATIEPADVGAFVGNVYVPAEATLATIEAADVGAFTGGVQVAGTLGTIEAPDVAALAAAVRWSAALATTEAPDVAAFLGATRWIAALATTEAPDVAALTGVTRWSGTLAASEAPDTAALTGAVRWAGALATVEAPDVAAFTGGIYASGPLAVTELPDVGAFLGGIYATGTLITTEAPDVAAFLGTAFGAGINANLAATEEADKAALTGQVTGVAGVLAASEAADVGAILGATRWVATLATIEAVDAVAFLGAARWVATLATTEAKDVAALVGAVRWVGALAASESPDVAAFTGIAGALPEGVVLAAIEAPDLGTFTGSTLTEAVLVTREAPDLAAFAGGQVGTGVLDTTEAPDRAAFTELPPDIADVPGRILSSDPLRVRSLAHGERVRVLAPQTPTNREMARTSARVRSLKYPIPRTHVLIKVLGTKTLTGA